MGTLCESVLEFIRKEKAHKQVILVINKCDLVPNWVTVSATNPGTPVDSMMIYPLAYDVILSGSIYPTSDTTIPDPSIPCVTKPFVWEGILDSVTPSVLTASLGQKADLGRVYWIPQRR